MSILVSPHFSWAETICHSGAHVPPEHRDRATHLAEDVLEPVRLWWGWPLLVISWYRDPEYNQRIHGAPKSRHMFADAVDLTPIQRRDIPKLRALIEDKIAEGELPDLGGLGVYESWIHLDARPRPADGHIARWFGKGVGSEM